MNFPFTPEHQMLREMARDFTNAEIRPLAQSIDKNESIPPELLKKIGEVGLMGTAIPRGIWGGRIRESGILSC